MTVIVGNYSLCAAVLVAVMTLLGCVAAVRLDSEGARRMVRRGMGVLSLVLTVSGAALMTALVNSDFRLAYVAEHTERALPVGYKIAAFWAGQEGSLLLWAWMLAVMSALFVVVHRRQKGPEYAVAAGVLAVAIGFFAVLMLFAANPFGLNPEAVADGIGLNPLLQDPAMIAHPPTLFVGYAGFTIPFALLLGALFSKRLGSDWVALARPWALVSWLFLGVGIVLGAQWAYVELGWGGYWAWDPVENASLLPWLTGTALLHSIIAYRQRGELKRWSAILTAGTFILCIFGTYITRSGVVQSVHAFGESSIAAFFQVFLFLTIALSVILILMRWSALRPENSGEGPVSRVGAFVAGNVLLVGMMLLTLLGTMFPVISRMIAGQTMSVSQSFYNRAVLPLGLVLVALMGLGPLLTYGRMGLGKLVRSLVVPLILAVAAIVTLVACGCHGGWALLAGAAVGMVAGGILANLFGTILARRENAAGGMIPAALRIVIANRRRYGAQLAHAGMAMMVIGVAGSSLYNTSRKLMLMPQQSAEVGRYTLKLNGIGLVRGENYSALQATVTMTDGGGFVSQLRPQRRGYDKWEQPSSEVAIQSTWREDLYVNLGGQDKNDGVVALEVFVNPLVSWIWAGGLVLTLGGLVNLVPRSARSVLPAEAQRREPARKPAPGMRIAAAH